MRAVRVASNPFAVERMVSNMLAGRKKLQVFDPVVCLVFVSMVDMEPIRDRSVVERPNVSMHELGSRIPTAVVAVVWVAIEPQSIELLKLPGRLFNAASIARAQLPIRRIEVLPIAINWDNF